MPDETSETQLDRIERKLDTYGVILTGNSKPERGHVVRMDRLEGRAKRSDRMQGVILTTVVGMVLVIIGATLTGVVRWLV